MTALDDNQNKWLTSWLLPDYVEEKTRSFNAVLNCVQTVPKSILDIGCGLAFESRQFYHLHKSEIWLLDGDYNDSPLNSNRLIRYGSADTIKFYNPIEKLKEYFDQQTGLRYQFVDANKIDVPKDKKFDLICSYLSCGYHYPVDTYKDLILTHSHADTKVIMDIRPRTVDEQCFDIKQIIDKRPKYVKAEIQLK
jgi:SAM-dependent methyltransferase